MNSLIDLLEDCSNSSLSLPHTSLLPQQTFSALSSPPSNSLPHPHHPPSSHHRMSSFGLARLKSHPTLPKSKNSSTSSASIKSPVKDKVNWESLIAGTYQSKSNNTNNNTNNNNDQRQDSENRFESLEDLSSPSEMGKYNGSLFLEMVL